MKKVWKKYHSEIIPIVIMVIVGSSMHFVRDLVNNDEVMKILGIVFPVNETSWEHMKMIWYPFLVTGIILSITKKNPGYFGGFVLSGIIDMLAIVGVFAIYQSFTVTSILILDIFLFITFMIFFSLLAYLFARQKWCQKALPVWIIAAVIVTGGIIYLPYHPGPGYVFLDNEGF